MILNSKHEARNSKQYLNLIFLVFEFVLRQTQDGERSRTISDLEIRISDLSKLLRNFYPHTLSGAFDDFYRRGQFKSI